MFPLYVRFINHSIILRSNPNHTYTAVSLNLDVDTDKELMAHGYSNLLAGMFGTV